MKRQDTRSPGVSCGRHVELCDRELHLSENMHGDTEVQTGTFEEPRVAMLEKDGFSLLSSGLILSDSDRALPDEGGSQYAKEVAGVQTPGNARKPEEAVGEQRKHLSSSLRTFLNLFISFLGVGLLSIPYAFKKSGLFLSVAMLVIVGVTCTYCMWMLTRCKYLLLAIRGQDGRAQVTYAEVCQAALGKAGVIAVEGALVASQSGFTISYLVFIARNLHALFDIKATPVMVACLPGLVVLCLIRHVTYLAPFSLLAEVVNLMGLAVVFFEDAEFLRIDDNSIEWVHWTAIPFVFGVAMFCYEGIGVVLPLEGAMANSEKFTPVLFLVMAIVTMLFITSGTLGYLAFGDTTQDIILLNIGSRVSTFVKLSFCVGLYFTFPLMMVPIWEVLEFKWLRNQPSSLDCTRGLIRAGGVIGTGIIAVAVPNFSLFLSLIGSSFCSVLAFVLPMMCYARLSKTSGIPLGIAQSLLNNCILLCGLLVMVLGTVDAIHNFVAGYMGHSDGAV